MAGLLRVSEAATLGLHALAFLAQNPARRNSSREMARVLQASEAHLAKVMQRLERAGLVRGRRGPAGGFMLLVPAEKLSLLRVYEAIEGPLQSEQCLLGQPISRHACPLGRLIKGLERDLAKKLEAATVADFATQANLRKCSGFKETGGKIHAAQRRNAGSRTA
ncbi:MAG: Rrf2 family transcriptional regulator [candidate division FCPU426 bacterium]